MSLQRHLNTKQRLLLLTFIPALIIYLLTMPTGLTFAHYGVDGGDLIAASVKLGIPHPPGYPLYVLLGKGISLFPIGSVAYRFNLLSGLSMAAATSIVTLISASQLPKPDQHLAIPMGLTVAFTPLVWQQAIIAEVYGVLMLCLSLTLYGVVTQKPPFQVGVFWGLSIVSHLTAVLLLPILLIYLWNHRRPAMLAQFLGGLFIGLLPFLALPFLALTQSPVMWGNPLTIGGFFNLISAQIYQTLPFRLPVSQMASRLQEWVPILLNQFTLAGVPLLLLSLWQFTKQAASKQAVKEASAWAISLFLYVVYAFFYNSGDAIVFTLPAILLTLLLMRNSFVFLKSWAYLLPLTLILLNFTSININQDRFVHQQLDNLFAQVPQNALLETSGEAILFPLWYAKFVDNQREDILLFDNQLFTYDWYRDTLKIQDDSITEVGEDISQFRMQQRTKRPYCNIVSQSEQERAVRVNCTPTIRDQ